MKPSSLRIVCLVCLVIASAPQGRTQTDTANMTAEVTTLEPTTTVLTTVMTTEAMTTGPTTGPTTATSEPTTTATDNMTTTASMTTQTKPTMTTSHTRPTMTTERKLPTTNPVTDSPVWPPQGTWDVTNDDGVVCMKMAFSSRLYIGYQNTSNDWTYAPIDVPTTAVTDGSVCGAEGEPRVFILHLFDARQYWYLNFTFSGDSKYALEEVGIAWTYTEEHFPHSKDINVRTYQFTKDANFLNNSVPFSKSYTCGKGLQFHTQMTTIVLQQLQLMPYAENAEGDFGKNMECSTPSDSNPGLIIGVVVGSIAFVLLIIGAFAMAKYRSNRSGVEDLQHIVN